jgi:hypothetical protein
VNLNKWKFLNEIKKIEKEININNVSEVVKGYIEIDSKYYINVDDENTKKLINKMKIYFEEKWTEEEEIGKNNLELKDLIEKIFHTVLKDLQPLLAHFIRNKVYSIKLYEIIKKENILLKKKTEFDYKDEDFDDFFVSDKDFEFFYNLYEDSSDWIIW